MIGTRLRALRRLCGMSQQRLAEEMNVSPSAVGMYEQDRREPSLDRLVVLARRFGVSTDYLLTGTVLTEGDKLAAAHFEAMNRAECQKTQKTVDRSALHAL